MTTRSLTDRSKNKEKKMTEKQELENKKEKILEIFQELVLEKGYSKVSVEEITSSLGISKGSFYSYFKSKKDMVLECIEDRKSTRLNSSHANISYAVFCLKKK